MSPGMARVLSDAEVASIDRVSVPFPPRLLDQLRIWFSLANEDPNIEIEARFTRCGITQPTWARISDHLNSMCALKMSSDTKVTLYNDDVRECSGVYIRKEKRCRFDLDEYGVRVALARETAFVGNPGPPVATRRRHRTSYELPGLANFRFDCSRIENFPSKTETFEVEIEYVARASDAIETFSRCIHLVLTITQGSRFVLPARIAGRLTDVYRDLFRLKDPYFVGAQPETLHAKAVREIRNGSYIVGSKTDGDRGLLLSLHEGCFLLDRRMRWRCLSLQKTSSGPTVLDVELLGRSDIVAFDILIVNGNDIRGSISFSDRLACLKQFIAPTDINFAVKEYFQYRWGMTRSLSSIMGSGDGLIFVPERQAYPKCTRWPSLLKWKPPHENSIDLALSSDGVPHVGEERGLLVRFRPDNTDVRARKDKVAWQHMDVVECTYDQKTNEFVPQRVRVDKLKPNFITVARDVWLSIKNPVELRQLNLGPAEALRIHLNYVHNYRAHELMRVIQKKTAEVCVLDVDNKTCDMRRLSTAAGKRNLTLSYLKNKPTAETKIDAVQLHHVLDGKYGSQDEFDTMIASLPSDAPLLSLIYMNGMAIIDSVRRGKNAHCTIDAHFDHRIWLEGLDVSNDFGFHFTFTAGLGMKRISESKYVVMPDALTLHLARHGFQLASSETFPDPTDKTLELSTEERDYNDLFTAAVYRRATPQSRWRVAPPVLNLAGGSLISSRPSCIKETLHMVTGIVADEDDVSALATAHSTIINIVDAVDGTLTAHTPTHVGYIDQPATVTFVVEGGKFFVVGIQDKFAPPPQPVRIRSFPKAEDERIIETLESRALDRSRGAWTIKDLLAFAKKEPILSNFDTSLKKKQDIHDELMRLARSGRRQ